jgi:uncharacterized protein (DUF58 family)
MQSGDTDLASLGSKIALVLALGMVVYVLPRLARNVRLDGSRSELWFRLTTGGWLFCAILMVVAILALSTTNNLLYLVLAVLSSTLIVSVVASRLSLIAINVRLRFPDHIFADEPARLEVTLHNRKRILPSFSLAVSASRQPDTHEKAPVLDRLAYFAVVPAGAHSRAQFDTRFPRRGVYPVRGFIISTRFPFGFSERRRLIDASGEIIVYPRPHPLDDFYHLLPITQGQMESPARGSGSDLHAIRRYLRPDHPHHIDWKATAKTTQLMVREFSRDDDWRVTIALDTGSPALPAGSSGPHDTGSEFEEKFERAVTLTASLITHFIAEGAEVRLLLGADDVGFGATQAHAYKLLGRLARLSLSENSAGTGTSEPVSLVQRMPALDADDQFKILITHAPRGTIPARVWRAAHVIYFDDLAEERAVEDAEAHERPGGGPDVL